MLDGKQLKSRVRTNSLDVYRRGFHGVLPSIWKKQPQEIISVRYNKGWSIIKKRYADWLSGNSKEIQVLIDKNVNGNY